MPPWSKMTGFIHTDEVPPTNKTEQVLLSWLPHCKRGTFAGTSFDVLFCLEPSPQATVLCHCTVSAWRVAIRSCSFPPTASRWASSCMATARNMSAVATWQFRFAPLIGHLEVPVMSSPWRDDDVPQHWHVAARLQVYATKFDDFRKVHGPKKQCLQNSVYAYRTKEPCFPNSFPQSLVVAA